MNADKYIETKKKQINGKVSAAENHKCRHCEWLSHYYLKSNYDTVFKCILPRCIK